MPRFKEFKKTPSHQNPTEKLELDCAFQPLQFKHRLKVVGFMPRLVTLSYNSHHRVSFTRPSANILHNTPTYCILIRKCWLSLGSGTQPARWVAIWARREGPLTSWIEQVNTLLHFLTLCIHWKFPGSPKINVSLPVKSSSKTEAPDAASHNHNVLLVHFAGSITQTPGSHHSGVDERSAHESVLLNSTKQKYVKPSWWRRKPRSGCFLAEGAKFNRDSVQCKWAVRR